VKARPSIARRAPRAARPGPGGRGFTLIEVLIAIAIVAAMAAMTAGAFRGIDRAAEIVREQDERLSAARVALTRMAHELEMAFLSEHYDHARFRDRPTFFRGREDELLFSTMAHERLYRDAKESDQAMIEYQAEAVPDGGGDQGLFRREKARIDDEPERGGRKDLVADHVAALRLRYWDAKRKEWVKEWNTRSTERANELPVRVRIELDLKAPGGAIEKFSTEARIAMTRPLEF
jgi:general secretion pathway protein J